MTRIHFAALVSLLVTAFISCTPVQAQLLFERQPINYSKSSSHDAVAKLNRRIAAGDVTLSQQSSRKLLDSLLDALDIQTSSQTLVFSKTSLQRHLISSKNPRAIYFNDNTYVGWIPNGEMIEIASTDPELGTVFYVIEMKDRQRSIVRRNDRCLFCHASTDSGRVPGLLMQSVYTDVNGNRAFPLVAIPSHAKGPLIGRWAGWFVTGEHGAQPHLGNQMVRSDSKVTLQEIGKIKNVRDLSSWVDLAKYPTQHSDIVALLVLQHQVTMHNLLTSVNHRARRWIYDMQTNPASTGDPESNSADETRVFLDLLAQELVDGLLMVDAVKLTDRITGSSSFAADFSSRAPVDSHGRSLRQLDLHQRLFRYPCSYLIYTDSFDALPDPLLVSVYSRLRAVLHSTEETDEYQHISASDRIAIAEILRETKSNLPADWTSSAK